MKLYRKAVSYTHLDVYKRQDGYRKGFLRIAMEMAAYILTILLGIWLTPVVGNVIRDHTSVEQALQKRFSESVAESIDQTAEGAFGEVEEYLKDVYKRQGYKRLPSGCARRALQRKAGGPVSYTHLDVYKRQT